MTVAEVKEALDAGAVPLDLRTPRPFATEHVPGAVNLQFNRADLADRAELILPKDASYVLHAEPEPLARIALSILRDAGFDVRGHLEGGLEAWKAAGYPTESVETLGIEELKDRLGELPVVDVREGYEYRHAHVPGARNHPWTELWAALDVLPAGERLAVVCGDEVRSTVAASILQREGRTPILVLGGMVDWLERGYPTEQGAAPSDS